MTQDILLEPYNPKWPEIFKEEKEKIYNALGFCTDGGVLYRIEHIGSTSVPDLAAKPCIDIMVDAYPLPLSKVKIASLENNGYKYWGEHGMLGREYFTKGEHEVHLHIFAFANEHWQRHILFRDYLRANSQARDEYQELKLNLAEQFSKNRGAYQAGKAELIARLEHNALNWHIKETAFRPLVKIAKELKDLPCPWAIASGWALEMYMGQTSRYHADIDIVISRENQLCLQKRLLANNWDLHFVVAGEYFPWYQAKNIDQNSHQIHARRADEFLDILIEENSADLWKYRRDETITLPVEQTISYFKDIPYRRPEINLLYKSRANRAKDAQDFKRVYPKLSSKSQIWLKEILAKTKPDHIWLKDMS